MDDSCAVCADALEWVAYGSCGHRDVCSTCVVRLRFICNDRRCCICKTESPVVFITKALGDYTRMINNFSVLPPEPKEGQVGAYWYHEDSQAFFDEVDHYKMIKAMCRLSCSVCNKMEEESNDGSKRQGKIRNIKQLKGHLFRQHRLLMCSLCLEGRKVFICEQKLYTRTQLNRHISTGDSEVDGNESERGGFMGHPMCEFCKTPFYGDNELYTHMSTDHYTCHICQRQHPGQYEYYRNYDDLEIHFRRDHFLCEDEACLAKKFIVFQTEAEMKRHNTLEHGGHMSRSKRNAALQIPTSFRYRQGTEQDHRRGRGRTFQRDQSDNQLSIAIQASLDTAHLEGTSNGPSSSSSAQVVSDRGEEDGIDPLIQPFESLTATDTEASSRYLQALGQGSRNSSLQESSFPPLPICSSSGPQKTKHESEGLRNNTMAAHLRRQNNTNAAILNSSQAWPAGNRGRLPSSTQFGPTNTAPSVSQSSASATALSSYAGSIRSVVRSPAVRGHASATSPGISHSSSAPNLVERGLSEPSVSDFPPVSATQVHSVSDFPPVSATQVRSVSDFPPVSATQVHRTPPSNQPLPNLGDVQIANRSLVEKIRAALEYNEEKYTAFKDISARYRQGSIDTGKYLNYVNEYGLSHLVLDLARLCPDAQKQRELVEMHNASKRSNGLQENGWGHGIVHVQNSTSSRKAKEIDADGGSSKDRFVESIMSTVRTLQSHYKPQEEEVEVLSKDGYRSAKGKSHAMVDEQLMELRGQNDLASAGNGSNQNVMDGGGGNKQRKKTSKFHRLRLGDGSMAAIMDLKNPDPSPDPADGRPADNNQMVGGLPVRGVWRKGGGSKLFP